MEETFDPSLDYYDILGVSPDASADAIRSAYVQLGNLFKPILSYDMMYDFYNASFLLILLS